MKKFLALILALALICSFGVVAFADDSPVKSSPAKAFAAPKKAVYPVCDLKTDEVVKEIPAEEVAIVAVDAADTLDVADKEAFLAAVEAAKGVTGKAVKDIFWLDLGEEEIGEGNYLKFPFECEGENVQVQVNGKDMEVVAEDAPNAYFAKLTEVGAVAILCDAE